MDFPINIISASAFGSFGDIYRFEDGSGNASGPFLFGRSSYCGFGRVQGQGLDQNETEEGGVGGHRDMGRRHSVTTMVIILSSRSSRFGLAEMNINVVQPSVDIGEQRQQ
ncbi:uncharacterized protein LOC124461750 [Drosophila willistoni]|uniref:uncharacterized protein LOC124461750 n=1 Tax=Drosophila willistoni TaxID=7260 RepID=UPI001F084C63|nr:uncharacterized protein LOC124461750 [Drosophila willistoni]